MYRDIPRPQESPEESPEECKYFIPSTELRDAQANKVPIAIVPIGA